MTPTKEAPKQSQTNGSLKSALADSVAQARAVEKREEAGSLVAGPFPVGNIGTVEVRAVERGSTVYTNAVFTPASGGKKQRIPLAAVATLHEELGA